MPNCLTSAQMRALEGAAIASGAVTGLELMERAGAGVVTAIFEEWPDLAAEPGRAGVLAGPGNNGGDGFVIARLLAERGWAVEVFLYGDPAALPGDAGRNAARWTGMGGAVSPMAPDADPAADLWIDAVFGTGLTRPLPPEVVAAFDRIATARNLRLVAVDILSGLHSDTGERLSALPVSADLTVTFHSVKCGHVRGAGPEVSGRVVVADIGL